MVDVRDRQPEIGFYIIDDTYGPGNNRGFVGIAPDKGVTIGRHHNLDKFDYPPTVSGDHFRVNHRDGGLYLTNLKPLNRTIITANLKAQESASPHPERRNFLIEDRRTELGEDRLKDNPNYREKDESGPYGYYFDHPIIGRNSTSVDGGVYLGGGEREAIVVDGKSENIRNVYDSLVKSIRGESKDDQTLSDRKLLYKVMHQVQEVMKYDANKVGKLETEYAGDKLVNLSTFVKENAGVCRHQGLLAAYLIERLINDGYLLGAVGVERNTVYDLNGTHAWAIYKPFFNKPEAAAVVDPAQSFVGTKQQADDEGRWAYRLPTDDY